MKTVVIMLDPLPLLYFKLHNAMTQLKLTRYVFFLEFKIDTIDDAAASR